MGRKFKIEYFKLEPKYCNFFFYSKSGSYGMYCTQYRKQFFCIPFVIGVMRVKSWGSNYKR